MSPQDLDNSILKIGQLLKAKGVESVRWVYSGAEGQGSVHNVDYFSSNSRFLKFHEIDGLKIPEIQIYEMGTEVLFSVKPNWCRDWGGQGEIWWTLSNKLRLDHLDRFEEEHDLAVEITPFDILTGLHDHKIPKEKLTSYQSLSAGFQLNQEGMLISNIKVLAEEEEQPSCPKDDVSALLRPVIEAVIQKAFKDHFTKHMIAIEGTLEVLRDLSGKINGIKTVERYEPHKLFYKAQPGPIE